MFYAGVFSFDMNMIKQAAKIGDGFAQAYLARYGEIEDRFMWARLSAQQGNRGGLFALGQALVQALYLRRTSAKEGEKYESAASVFKRAAEMGHCEAMCKHAYNLEHTDPKQVLWLYEAGLRSQFGQFFEFLEIRLVDCNDWVSVYEFGRLLKKVEITFDNDNQKLLAIRAIELYDKWSSRAREAVYAWRIVSRRLMLHKDVAGIISRIVWDGRRTDYNEK